MNFEVAPHEYSLIGFRDGRNLKIWAMRADPQIVGQIVDPRYIRDPSDKVDSVRHLGARFNGHLSSANSDVRDGNNYQNHVKRFGPGLVDWWTKKK